MCRPMGSPVKGRSVDNTEIRTQTEENCTETVEKMIHISKVKHQHAVASHPGSNCMQLLAC